MGMKGRSTLGLWDLTQIKHFADNVSRNPTTHLISVEAATISGKEKSKIRGNLCDNHFTNNKQFLS